MNRGVVGTCGCGRLQNPPSHLWGRTSWGVLHPGPCGRLENEHFTFILLCLQLFFGVSVSFISLTFFKRRFLVWDLIFLLDKMQNELNRDTLSTTIQRACSLSHLSMVLACTVGVHGNQRLDEIWTLEHLLSTPNPNPLLWRLPVVPRSVGDDWFPYSLCMFFSSCLASRYFLYVCVIKLNFRLPEYVSWLQYIVLPLSRWKIIRPCDYSYIMLYWWLCPKMGSEVWFFKGLWCFPSSFLCTLFNVYLICLCFMYEEL